MIPGWDVVLQLLSLVAIAAASMSVTKTNIVALRASIEKLNSTIGGLSVAINALEIAQARQEERIDQHRQAIDALRCQLGQHMLSETRRD